MRIISVRALVEFGKKHPAARTPLAAWRREIEAGRWTGPAQLKASFASASFLANNRVVFNIGGNSFRLVVKVVYGSKFPGKVFVRFIGSHSEYDKIDASTV